MKVLEHFRHHYSIGPLIRPPHISHPTRWIHHELYVLHTAHCCRHLILFVLPIVYNGLRNVNDANLGVRTILVVESQIESEIDNALTDYPITFCELFAAHCFVFVMVLIGSSMSEVVHHIVKNDLFCNKNYGSMVLAVELIQCILHHMNIPSKIFLIWYANWLWLKDSGRKNLITSYRKLTI